jgi:hypothetical protein
MKFIIVLQNETDLKYFPPANWAIKTNIIKKEMSDKLDRLMSTVHMLLSHLGHSRAKIGLGTLRPGTLIDTLRLGIK